VKKNIYIPYTRTSTSTVFGPIGLDELVGIFIIYPRIDEVLHDEVSIMMFILLMKLQIFHIRI